ncbi:MAG: hypothetical protein Q9191_004796 [Dirinaria sp. TL-2023a]
MASAARNKNPIGNRAFMTRLRCIHEPFGDAFYYGPERLGSRFENDEQIRIDSGFSESTFQTTIERLLTLQQGKRLFIKDMAHYLLPPDGKPASIAPSLARIERGIGTSKPSKYGANGVHETPYPYHTAAEVNNPTVIPEEILKRFHFTFLIRHPRLSVPSYYRCTVPPLDAVTGFYDFRPSEAGYDELRRVFDYLRTTGQIGPKVSGQDLYDPQIHARATNDNVVPHKNESRVDICVVDADDLLDNPAGVMEVFCQSVGLEYDEKMLVWDSEEDHKRAKEAFEKWKGFHEDAIESSGLKPRLHGKTIKSVEDEDREWTEKYGEEGAKVIRATVNASIEDYEYLKQFALKV